MADYYVNSLVGGPGAGTIGDPWDDYRSHVGILAAGDTMYLRGHTNPATPQVYNEALTWLSNVGGVGNPITIKAYPGEYVTLREPTGAVFQNVFNIDGDYYLLQDLDLDKEDNFNGGCVDIEGDNNVILDCTLHNVFGGWIVRILGGDDNDINGCEIWDGFRAVDNDCMGILVNGGDDNILRNNVIHTIYGDHIQIIDSNSTQGTQILDNTLINNVGKCAENAIDVKRNDGTQIVISGNIMAGFRACDATCGGTGNLGGEAIIIHIDGDNVLIEDNIIYDCTSGIRAQTDDITIRNNVIRDLVVDGIASFETAIIVSAGADSTLIYNNTFHNIPVQLFYVFATATNCIIKNNIFNDTNDITVEPGAGIVYDYNGWFNAVDTLVGVNDTTGADPQFNDEAADDYTLARLGACTYSVCIDVGTNVGLPFNNVAPDLGAYEYPTFGPGIMSITPNSGTNDAPVSITNLAGCNFVAGATVILTKAAEANINGTGVVVLAVMITCDFDITGVTPGLWTVRVTNPDAQYYELVDGFTVVQYTPPVPPPVLTYCVEPVKSQQETIQLLAPSVEDTYELFDLTELAIIEAGLGAAPSHLITQRGVRQHGATVVDMRLDPKTVIVSFGNDSASRNRLWDKRRRLLSLVNVGRSFDELGTVTPYVYRKTMPGGDYKWRNDLVTTSGSDTVTSVAGRFAQWGLDTGASFNVLNGVDVGEYTVLDVTNENTLVLDAAMTSTATGIAYELLTGPIVRDLDVLIEQAPSLPDDKRIWSSSYMDSLRLVTHRVPVWYNPLELRLETTIGQEDNLIFYESPDWEDRAVFPIWFGSDDVLVTYSITYLGTWPTRPIVVATGPFDYIEMENLSVAAKVGLLYTAATGETVTLDINAQRAYNNLGVSLTRYITEESNMSAMYLYNKSVVADGINLIRAGITGGTADVSTVTVFWNSRDNGI